MLSKLSKIIRIDVNGIDIGPPILRKHSHFAVAIHQINSILVKKVAYSALQIFPLPKIHLSFEF